MQVATTGGGSVGGVNVDAMYPTPLPRHQFEDDDGNELDVTEINSHIAVLGKSGDGKTPPRLSPDHAVGVDEAVESWLGNGDYATGEHSCRALGPHSLITR